MAICWHELKEIVESPSQPHPKPSSSHQPPPYHLLFAMKKTRRVLILDLEGLLLKTIEVKHGDSMPAWTQHMRIVEDKDEVYHVVRPDTEMFLDFCAEYFELWIWSCYNLTRVKHITQKCFPEHYIKFKVFMSNKNCQNPNIMLGFTRVYHKNLSDIWKIFEDLDANNTLIFDDTPYRVMWNMPGTYLIFPKMWRQTSEQLQSFLWEKIVPWLLGWLYARDKRVYTYNTIVNQYSDSETNYVLGVYLSRRKH